MNIELKPNTDPLNIGDEVEVFENYTGMYIPNCRYKVRNIVDGEIYQATCYRFNGSSEEHHEFSSYRFKWRKCTSAKEISKLVLPGKPLLVIGKGGPTHLDGSSNRRSDACLRAIQLIEDVNNIKHICSRITKPSELTDLHRKFLIKNNVFFIGGIHHVNSSLDSEKIDRIIAFLMRNKKRRVILTGSYCNSLQILKMVANTINFVL